MKRILGLLLIIAASASAESDAPENFVQGMDKIGESQLMSAIENLRNTVLGEMPFVIPEIQLKTDSTSLRADLLFKNAEIYGLKYFAIENPKITGILSTVNLTISLDALFATIDYSGFLEAFGLLNLHGNGKIKVSLFDLSVDIYVKRAQLASNETLQLSELALPQMSLGEKSEIQITGLFGDEPASISISRELTAILLTLINDYGYWLNENLSPTLMNLINGLITFTLQDLLSGALG